MVNRKVLLWSGVSFVLIVLAIILYFVFANSRNYVVSINGEKVGIGEFKLMLDSIKSQMTEKGVTNFDIVVEGKKASEVAKEKTLESIINYRIEAQQAKKQNISLTNDEIQNISSSISNESSQNPKFVQKLKDFGLTINDFKNIYMDFNLANKLKQKVYSEINAANTAENTSKTANKYKMSDEEVRNFYDQNKDLYTYSEEYVRARHILIKTIDQNNNPLPADKQEDARKRAEALLARAKAGEDFAALAKQYTEDEGSKENGGEYTFKRGDMVKEFEDAAFALKPGEISGLVKTKYGYHIIKLEQKYEPGQIMNFDEIKSGVKLDAQYSKVLEAWKKQSVIKRNDEVYKSITV